MYIKANDYLHSLMRFAKENDIYSKMHDALNSAAHDYDISVYEFLVKHVEFSDNVALIAAFMDVDTEELTIIGQSLKNFLREKCGYRYGDRIFWG